MITNIQWPVFWRNYWKYSVQQHLWEFKIEWEHSQMRNSNIHHANIYHPKKNIIIRNSHFTTFLLNLFSSWNIDEVILKWLTPILNILHFSSKMGKTVPGHTLLYCSHLHSICFTQSLPRHTLIFKSTGSFCFLIN